MTLSRELVTNPSSKDPTAPQTCLCTTLWSIVYDVHCTKDSCPL